MFIWEWLYGWIYPPSTDEGTGLFDFKLMDPPQDHLMIEVEHDHILIDQPQDFILFEPEQFNG